MTQLFTTFFAAAEAPAPAGGAALTEVIIATILGGVLTGGVVLIALAYRNGRAKWLGSLAEFAGRQTGLPGWAALPLAVLTASLVSAVFGLYWDISLHLNNGRDEGPLANPSHYFILIGLLGVFSAGVLAVTMPKPGTRPSPWSVRLSEGWYAPVGGILIIVSAAFGLAGFPLDDFWHRMFGQDVTLWGPTHLLMLTGAGLCLIGASVLLTEGALESNRTRGDRKISARDAFLDKGRRAMAAGGLLIALSIYQGEFDYGIAQFRQIFDPIMIGVAAGVALTYARITAGKGGAILAVLFFIAVRGALTLIVTGIFDKPVAHFPIFIGAAIAVEIVGILMASSIRTKPMNFALAAGVAIGTLGIAVEWLWSNVWAIYPWGSALFPEGAIAGFIAAVSGAFIGTWMANSLMLRPKIKGALRFAPIAGLLAIIVLVGLGLRQDSPTGLTATLTNTPADTGKPGTWVNTTVKLNTTKYDTDQNWAKSIAWQGPGFVVADLEKVGPGEYKTTEPLPAFGKWKSMVRFQSGSSMMGAPVFEPEDAAIPAAEVPASPNVTRELMPDREILQRESKIEGGWVAGLGYLAVFLIAMTLLGTLAWGIWRISTPLTEEQEGDGLEEGSLRPPRTSRSSGPSPSATPRTT